MASHHASGVPPRRAPTASRRALLSEGSGVTATRNGLRRTSSASMYCTPVTRRSVSRVVTSRRLRRWPSGLLVDVLAADAVALEGVHGDPGHREGDAVAGGYRQQPAAHAERAGHGGRLNAELTALIGG